MKKLFFVISFTLATQCYAQERIQAMRFDRSEVARIYLAPGLGSIVLFPCPLVETFIGRSDDLKAQISPNDKKTLFLNLKLNSSLPTNLIARCESERGVFVFDVVPSKANHQDVVEIRGAFGSPRNPELSRIKVPAAQSSKIVMSAPVLIEKGSSK